MKRESFKSRLGFLLVSAGCAIGIGNVWRFPYVAGQNGGGFFVLLYLILSILYMVFAGFLKKQKQNACSPFPHSTFFSNTKAPIPSKEQEPASLFISILLPDLPRSFQSAMISDLCT